MGYERDRAGAKHYQVGKLEILRVGMLRGWKLEQLGRGSPFNLTYLDWLRSGGCTATLAPAG